MSESVEKKPCVLCKQLFDSTELDFLDRCPPCFHLWMITPEDQRTKLGVPYVPIYNGD